MVNIFKLIRFIYFDTIQHILSFIPNIIGKYIRRFFYKLHLAKCGNNFSTGVLVRLQSPEAIYVGNNSGFSDRCWVAANSDVNGSITIGNNVLIGPGTLIHSGNHNYKNKKIPIRHQGFQFASIVIKDDVWIAANCTILAGVTIGKGAVVAAGSVVTKNIEPYTVVGGIPAKVISKRE